MRIARLYSRFLLLIAASLTAVAAHADNYFYIDIPVMTDNDWNTNITLPVKAHFDKPVSTWDVEFSFPEGLTPVSATRGSDMNFTYFDYDCNVRTQKCYLFNNEDLTHFASSTFGMRAYLSEDDYEYDNSSLLKWDAGTYEEMFLMTFRVDAGCYGGDIQVVSRTTCAETPDITFDPDQTFSVECDINLDGCISIADNTELLWIIAGVEIYDKNNRDEEEPGLRGDVNHDGVVNIIDLEMLNDYINLDAWFTGYELNEVITSIEALIVVNEPPYIEFNIFEPTELTEADYNHHVTIPVYASFWGDVSAWDVQFSFPEGLTPVSITPGSAMTLTFTDSEGQQHSQQAAYATSQDNTHIVACTSGMADYRLTDDDTYELCGSAKWGTSDNYEMLLLTVLVEPSFSNGDITIQSRATCGKDLRSTNYFWPVDMEEPVDEQGNYYGYLYGDVDHDGIISIADMTAYLEYLVGNLTNDYFAVNEGDTHQNGVIDIRDLEKTRDLLFFGQWYEGYLLGENESSAFIHMAIPGDMNGDGILTVSDITILINLLLNSGENYYSNLADMNSDGVFNISDVTLLISSVLNAQQ